MGIIGVTYNKDLAEKIIKKQSQGFIFVKGERVDISELKDLITGMQSKIDHLQMRLKFERDKNAEKTI